MFLEPFLSWALEEPECRILRFMLSLHLDRNPRRLLALALEHLRPCPTPPALAESRNLRFRSSCRLIPDPCFRGPNFMFVDYPKQRTWYEPTGRTKGQLLSSPLLFWGAVFLLRCLLIACFPLVTDLEQLSKSQRQLQSGDETQRRLQ